MCEMSDGDCNVRGKFGGWRIGVLKSCYITVMVREEEESRRMYWRYMWADVVSRKPSVEQDVCCTNGRRLRCPTTRLRHDVFVIDLAL